MDKTPALSRFDEFYRTSTPPWVIGEPQPAIVELERAGRIRGKVLDVGCGTGEHTILLTRLGYDVLGIDFAPEAIEQARRNAEEKGVGARFEVADAMNLRRRPALRHHRRQRAVPHLRRHRPAASTSPACTTRAGPAAPCTCSRCPTQDAASDRRSATTPSGRRSPTGGSSRRSTRRPTAVSSRSARRGDRAADRHPRRRARLAR